MSFLQKQKKTSTETTLNLSEFNANGDKNETLFPLLNQNQLKKHTFTTNKALG